MSFENEVELVEILWCVCVRGLSYGSHLIVELWQDGVGAQICGVFLKELQLFMKPVLIFFTTIPATTHGAEQNLTGLATPLENYYLLVV